MKKRPGEKPAREVLDELRRDPEWMARRLAWEEKSARSQAEYRKAEEPVIRDLRDLGLRIDTLWDLVNSDATYPEAVPTLLEHLQLDYPPKVKEAIGRSLAVPGARIGWQTLMSVYKETSEPIVKDALACALPVACTEDVIEDIIDLVRDPQHGDSRLLLLAALAASQNDRAHKVLREAANDPALQQEATRLLRLKERGPRQ